VFALVCICMRERQVEREGGRGREERNQTETETEKERDSDRDRWRDSAYQTATSVCESACDGECGQCRTECVQMSCVMGRASVTVTASVN
jgi:hypothetical protein